MKILGLNISGLFFLLLAVNIYASTDVLDMKADYSSGLVKIQWQTSLEVNVREFIIEKSSDNISFNKLTTENPKGSSSTYSVFDLNPHSKNTVLYYRVVVVDYDGFTNTSNSTSVKIESSGITATWGSIKALFR